MDTPLKTIARKRLVLVGQPNVGKSVLFNALTGQYVAVSNYPGTTVEISRGFRTVGRQTFEVIDSPGINSLVTQSDEEKATRSYLLERPDVVVQVGNASQLERVLMLTLELAELNIPLVLCLNMKDEAHSRGIFVDVPYLARRLGIPVVETVATTQEGIPELLKLIGRAATSSCRPAYPAEIERVISEMSRAVDPAYQALVPLLLENHTEIPELAAAGIHLPGEFWQKMQETQKSFVRPLSRVLMEARLERSKELTAESRRLDRPSASGGRWLETAGQWCLRPWPGYLFAAITLWVMYKFVAVFGAQWAVEFMEHTVFGRGINPVLNRLVLWALPWSWPREILTGPYGIFTMAVTYAVALLLPILSTFFLAMGVLEDSGYLPRLSVLLNRLFRVIGLNGKAVFPMILGFGCGTMAMLSCRILDTRKEKILASFLITLAVPCSAQLAVVLAMTAGISPSVLLVWFGVLASTLLVAGVVGSRILPGAPAPFFLEIPPMRIPLMRNILRKVGTRLAWYLREVVPLFILATLILYSLDALRWLQVLERWASPVVTGFLGLPARATDAFLLGFLRRDYGAAGLYQMQREGLLSLRQVTVSLVAMTLFMPCMAQVLMTWRERGAKVTAAIGLVVAGYAVLVSGVLNRVLLWGGWV
jgi:ferrous iron transport protein B